MQRADGRHVAPCPCDHRNDAILDDDDLRSFQIDVAALIQGIAAASDITDELEAVLPGVWHFGPIRSGRTVFVALSITAATQPGLIGILQAAARRLPISLIAPPLPTPERQRLKDAGIHLVATRNVIVGNNGLALALDLSRLEPDTTPAPRLVIARSAKSVSLDGISYALSDQTFKLLYLLAVRARNDQSCVTTRDIEQEIWGSSIHRVSRSARDVVRELRKALTAGTSHPAAARQLIANKRNRGWRLTLAAAEIEIRP